MSQPIAMIKLKTPAKINLSLAILGRRPDGFHEIESWAVPIGLFDELIFNEADDFQLTIQKSPDGLKPDHSNLVWRAAEALANHAKVPLRGRLALFKTIPIGAGLGGGSGNAAAALLGLNKLWQLNWPVERLKPIAAEIGSDVPFFLEPKSAVMRGRGELLEPLTQDLQGWVSLIFPNFGLATKAVYTKYAAINTEKKSAISTTRYLPCETSANRSLREIMSTLFNDLEQAAFAIEPRLAVIHAQLNSISQQPVRMTGSGSTLFSLFETQEDAEAWKRSTHAMLDSEVEMRVTPLLYR